MTQTRKMLLAGGACCLALMAAPALAQQTSTTVITNTDGTVYTTPAPADQTGSTTTVVTTTTTTGGHTMLADPIAHLKAEGYSDLRQVPGVTRESQMAFYAANDWGHPVTIIVDRYTGDVVRETSSRTLNKPSKQ
ncbi:MAG: hypothetical protein RH982_00470 [Parvibaculum sp.]